MLRRCVLLAAAALSFAPAAHATLIGDYELNGSLTNSAGPGALVADAGPTYAAGGTGTGASFARGEGFAADTPDALGVYTLDTYFSFTDTGGYRRIFDFLSRGSDTGLYVLSGALNFYNVTTSAGGLFAPDTLARVTVTRDADGVFTGYVNGAQALQFTDSGNLAVISNTLNIFHDDLVVPNENSAGFVDFVRVYDSALTSAQVAALPLAAPTSGVPEPASWALMIGGAALAGGALRRRRPSPAFRAARG